MGRRQRVVGWSVWTMAGFVALALLVLSNCANRRTEPTARPETVHQTPTQSEQVVPTDTPQLLVVADVVSVQAKGSAGAYQFSVEVSSPDTGCEQYADWWEVLDEQGQLLYRRILAHSHTSEQPFVRSGGPVAIDPETPVWVRAHMHPGGYGGVAFRGSVEDGFSEAQPEPDFAAGVADQSPLPDGCAF